METVILILMLLVCLSFVLKQTFQGYKTQALVSIGCLLLTVLSVPLAIEQSRTQIQQWLTNPDLMLDTSVVLFTDVFLQIAFVMTSARLMTSDHERRRVIWGYRLLRYFPGLLIIPVLFYTLVQMIFTFTGASFTVTGWCTGIAAALAIPVAALVVKRLLPERDVRLELLFLINILIAVIGVIATVNGRTAAAGISDIDPAALAGVVAIFIAGTAAGYIIFRIRVNRAVKHVNKISN